MQFSRQIRSAHKWASGFKRRINCNTGRRAGKVRDALPWSACMVCRRGSCRMPEFSANGDDLGKVRSASPEQEHDQKTEAARQPDVSSRQSSAISYGTENRLTDG